MFRLSGGRFSRRAQRVVASDQGVDISESDGVRGLHLGSVTLQSAMRLSAPFDLELAYTRGIMAFLLLAPQARHVLAIGLGGGSIPKFIHHYLPQLQTTVVEINPQVIQVARHHFLLPPDDARLQVIEADGVDVEHGQRGFGDRLVDVALALHVGVVPHPAQQAAFKALLLPPPFIIFSLNTFGSRDQSLTNTLFCVSISSS